MDFIAYTDIPKDRKVIYANFICNYRPLKTETFRVRMTIGGNRLDYPDEKSSLQRKNPLRIRKKKFRKIPDPAQHAIFSQTM